MADQIITKQELIDAQKDAKTLEDVVNGEAGKLVTSRLGRQYYTLATFPNLSVYSRDEINYLLSDKASKAYVDYEISKVAGGSKSYKTLAEANADKSNIPPNSTVYITNDDTNSGLYNYDGSTLTKSDYDPVNQAKIYTDQSQESQDRHFNSSLKKSVKYQFLNTKSSQIIPVVLDDDKSVLIGFNTIDKKIVAEGVLNATDFYKSGLRGIRSEANAEIHPIVLDAVGNVILGYSTASNSLVGSFDETGSNYQYKAEKFPYALVPNAWNQSITYGQSLSDGGGLGVTAISLTQPYLNLTFQGGVRVRAGGNFSSSKPLVEAGVETITSGFANYAIKSAVEKNGIKPSDHVLFSSACGASGTPIEQLIKGSDWWNQQFVPHIWGAYPLNNNTTIQCVCWLQGEANSGDNGSSYQRTRQQYKTLLLQLLNDINAETDQITPQTTPTIMLSYQHSSYAKLNNGGTQLGVLDACKEDDRIYFVAPTYAFPHLPDKLHLTSVSYKWLGAYFGRAYQQMMFDKIKPKSIKPLSALYQANKVTVTFDVPHAPLQFNTARLAQTQNFGFAVKKSNGTLYAITSVEIIDAVKVVITCSENIASGSVVRYALDYNTDLKEGATGNLFDSCADTVVIDSEEKPMQYACPHFEISTYTEVI